MSLIKYGFPKPKPICKTCYEPFNPDYKEAIKKGVGYNKKIACLGCKTDSICVMCSREYDGELYCESCYKEIEKGCC